MTAVAFEGIFNEEDDNSQRGVGSSLCTGDSDSDDSVDLLFLQGDGRTSLSLLQRLEGILAIVLDSLKLNWKNCMILFRRK